MKTGIYAKRILELLKTWNFCIKRKRVDKNASPLSLKPRTVSTLQSKDFFEIEKLGIKQAAVRIASPCLLQMTTSVMLTIIWRIVIASLRSNPGYSDAWIASSFLLAMT
jgi:hypothetical protein